MRTPRRIITLIIAAQLLIIGAVLIWSGYELGKVEDEAGPNLAA